MWLLEGKSFADQSWPARKGCLPQIVNHIQVHSACGACCTLAFLQSLKGCPAHTSAGSGPDRAVRAPSVPLSAAVRARRLLVLSGSCKYRCSRPWQSLLPRPKRGAGRSCGSRRLLCAQNNVADLSDGRDIPKDSSAKGPEVYWQCHKPYRGSMMSIQAGWLHLHAYLAS